MKLEELMLDAWRDVQIPGVEIQVLAAADDETTTAMGLIRPCVDCGLVTGSLCDYCRAAQRCPDEVWADNQMTPLCTHCDLKWARACHFCRGQQWCVPAPHPSALHVYFRRETPRTQGEQ